MSVTDLFAPKHLEVPIKLRDVNDADFFGVTIVNGEIVDGNIAKALVRAHAAAVDWDDRRLVVIQWWFDQDYPMINGKRRETHIILAIRSLADG
jgi:hypothetical protein